MYKFETIISTNTDFSNRELVICDFFFEEVKVGLSSIAGSSTTLEVTYSFKETELSYSYVVKQIEVELVSGTTIVFRDSPALTEDQEVITFIFNRLSDKLEAAIYEDYDKQILLANDYFQVS